MDLLAVLVTASILLALSLAVVGLYARRWRVIARRSETDLHTLRTGMQGLAEQQLSGLLETVTAKNPAIPSLDDTSTGKWFTHVEALLEQAAGTAEREKEFGAQRTSEVEEQIRHAGDLIDWQRSALEAHRASLWNLIGLRVPAMVNTIQQRLLSVPLMPDGNTDIRPWAEHVDRLLQDVQTTVIHERHADTQARALQATLDQGLHKELADLRSDLSLREDELRHLVKTRLPAVIESAAGVGVDEPGPWHTQLIGTDFADLVDEVLTAVHIAERHAEVRADDRAKAAVQAVMRTLRALGAESEAAISDMQAKHRDPMVLEGLLGIDHANSQLLRRIQAIAMVCGATPGMRRPDSSLSDVLRGAVSRIRDYLRVTIDTTLDRILVGHRVEHVVLALAELLDNAARHSTGTAVHVSMEPAHNGVAVIIDDGGIGMSSDAIDHANQLLTGEQPVRIRALGDPPQIGLAVCSVLVAACGFRVYLDSHSRYGGVRAALFLPQELLAATATPRHGLARLDTPARSSPIVTATAAESSPSAPPSSPSTTHGGLPIRTPRAASVPRRTEPPASPPAQERSSADQERSAHAISAWQNSTPARQLGSEEGPTS